MQGAAALMLEWESCRGEVGAGGDGAGGWAKVDVDADFDVVAHQTCCKTG